MTPLPRIDGDRHCSPLVTRFHCAGKAVTDPRTAFTLIPVENAFLRTLDRELLHGKNFAAG